MAKKDTGLKATLSALGPKVLIKKSEIDVEKTEAVVKNIHSKKDEKKVRQTVDLSEQTFKKFKVKLANEGKKAQQVLSQLIDEYVSQ